MSGFFGVASKDDCVLELFYGVDYHSHLGTRRGGMAVYGEHGFDRAIHNIENTPFRTKFDGDVGSMKGNMGIGCISDYEPQPLLFSSRIGSFALTFVGKINNYDELLQQLYDTTKVHFQEMTNGTVNVTELIAALICEKDNFVEGIQYVQGLIDGSMTLLLMTKDGIYAARDKMGRTPVEIGRKEGSYCISFESHAYINLGYEDYKELGPGEIVFVTADEVKTLVEPGKKMKICSFLWVYYGYPTASYEGVNVEEMRYRCGSMLAKRDGDSVHPDIVAGVPDSGIAHAIGYAMYGCKYLNFSRSKSEMELITRQVIEKREGLNCPQEVLDEYADPHTEKYEQMVQDICEMQNFTTLRYHRLDDLLESIGIDPCNVCTYCFNGKE